MASCLWAVRGRLEPGWAAVSQGQGQHEDADYNRGDGNMASEAKGSMDSEEKEQAWRNRCGLTGRKQLADYGPRGRGCKKAGAYHTPSCGVLCPHAPLLHTIHCTQDPVCSELESQLFGGCTSCG